MIIWCAFFNQWHNRITKLCNRPISEYTTIKCVGVALETQVGKSILRTKAFDISSELFERQP